jgi:hypothetical protein
MAKEKAEFIMPSGIEDQKKMMALIKEAVKYKQEIDVQKEDIKTVQEDLNDLFGMPSAVSNKYINHFYDQAKLPEQVKDIEDIIANSEIIAKYNK